MALDLLAQQYIHDTRNEDVAQKLKSVTPAINPSKSCLNWRLSFTAMANDNKLDDEQQLGVIAAHKSKLTTLVKGPNASPLTFSDENPNAPNCAR